MARRRLDAELTRRGLARSRGHAADLIGAGRVSVAGNTATKPATMVDPAAAISVASLPTGEDYVSRGAHKLLGAFTAFRDSGLHVEGRRCLDAGASTGGFTDVLLREGAAEVVAVDVGYGQLAWRLQNDPRVRVMDRTNVRSLSAAAIGGPVDVIVADLSFISLSLVMKSLLGCARDEPSAGVSADRERATPEAGDREPLPEPEALLLVKPQFEVGRQRLGKGGVVRDPSLRAETVMSLGQRAAELGWGVAGVVASPLPGPAGNVEYILWLRRSAPAISRTDVDRAVREGPA